MRLVSPRWHNGLRGQRYGRRSGEIRGGRNRLGQHVPTGIGRVRQVCGRSKTVRMHGNLLRRQRHRLHPASIGLSETVTEMNWHPSPQVRQGEGGLPIPPVHCANQLEQRFVF
jgi:hypothetical protein